MRVLIAEDDMISRKIMLKMLETRGECDFALNGIEAVDAVYLSMKEKRPYDLICLDIMLPKIDGLSVLKSIRDLERQMGTETAIVIIITALETEKVVKEAFDIGANAYATKPIDKSKFLEVLSKFKMVENE